MFLKKDKEEEEVEAEEEASKGRRKTKTKRENRQEPPNRKNKEIPDPTATSHEFPVRSLSRLSDSKCMLYFWYSASPIPCNLAFSWLGQNQHCCLTKETWNMSLEAHEAIQFQATTVLSRQQSPTHCADVLSLRDKARHQTWCLPQPSLSVVGLVLGRGSNIDHQHATPRT